MEERTGIWTTIISCFLSTAIQSPLIDNQSFQANRSTSVDLVSAYSHFGSKAESKPVGETGTGVPKHIRRVDPVHKLLRSLLIGSHNRIGMPRTVGINVFDRRIQAIDYLYCQNLIQIFSAPILSLCRFYLYIIARLLTTPQFGTAGIHPLLQLG